MFKEILGDAFPIIQRFAPFISLALSNPLAGELTSFGLNLLSNAFGVNPNEVQKLSESILSTQDPSSLLSNAEKEFTNWFKLNNIRLPNKLEFNIKIEWDNPS